MGDPTSAVEPIAEALPAMQALASRLWTPEARHHPGQLAWSYAYGLPEVLHHGPAAVFSRDDEVLAWAWAESDDWMELCVDPAALDAGDSAIGWFLDRAGDSAVRTMVLDTEEHVIALLDRAGFLVEDGPWFTHHYLDLAEHRRSSRSRATRSVTSSPTRRPPGPPATATPGARRRWSAPAPTSG